MNLTSYSHAQVTEVSSDSNNGTYWVDARLDGTLVTLFLSVQNLQGVKEWAAELLKMCVAVERGKLARVENEAQCLAKTNPIYSGPLGIFEDLDIESDRRIDVATGLTSFEDDDVPF